MSSRETSEDGRAAEQGPVVLVVDDCPTLTGAVAGLLQAHARVLVAHSGEQALPIVAHGGVDLVLLDLQLEGIDGLETLRRMRRLPQAEDVPVILVTSAGERENEEAGLELGAADFVRKPLRPGVLVPRVLNQLAVRRTRHELQDRNRQLAWRAEAERLAGERIADTGLLAIGHLAGTRDPETGRHLYRTRLYLSALCHELAQLPRWAAVVTPDFVQTLLKSAPLHDIGKVGIPDRILLKPGPLSAEEWAIMREHAAIGADALRRAQADGNGTERGYLDMAHDIARHHHERWDGTGYPDRLAGEAIPLAARVVAVADVYDALISARPYKRAFSPTESAAILLRGSGSQFDPELIAAFTRQRSEFERIALEHGDLPEEGAARGLPLRAAA